MLCLFALYTVQIQFNDATDIREYLQSFAPTAAKWHTHWICVEGYPEKLPVFFIDTGMNELALKDLGFFFVPS